MGEISAGFAFTAYWFAALAAGILAVILTTYLFRWLLHKRETGAPEPLPQPKDVREEAGEEAETLAAVTAAVAAFLSARSPVVSAGEPEFQPFWKMASRLSVLESFEVMEV